MGAPIEPVPASPDDGMVLTDTQVECWREHGGIVVDGVIPDDLVAGAHAYGRSIFPAPGTPEAESVAEFGSKAFPTGDPSFDGLVLHPRLLRAVARLLDVEPGDLRLTQADLWPKYGRAGHVGRYDNQDQRIHLDYPNHMLVHPTPWDRPGAVEIIVYLDDVAECGGGTSVVLRDGPDDPAFRWPMVDTPGVGALPWVNDRITAEARLAETRPDLAAWREALYDREQAVAYRPGSVLLYRHDVWHRGTPLHPGAMRLAVNLTYRRADAEWVNTLHPGWSWAMYRPDQYMERLVATATVDQRTVLGFPAPGDPYWCDQTRAAVAARYAPLGFDITPYIDVETDESPVPTSGSAGSAVLRGWRRGG